MAAAFGMRTSSSNSLLRTKASALLIPRRTRKPSESCEPILRTGFKAVIGSWKIIAMPEPKRFRTSSLLMAVNSWPSKMTVPERFTLLPCNKPIAARHITVLPLPDSPTTPTLVPAGISISTPRTASSEPRGVSKLIDMFLTLNNELILWPHDCRVLNARRRRDGSSKLR